MKGNSVKNKVHAIIHLATILMAFPVLAQSINCDQSYAFRADVNGSIGSTICNSKVDAFFDAAKNLNLSNKGYTDTSAATVQGRINDVNVILRYQANSTSLSYNFPELKVSGTFTGKTRDESEEKFVDYIKKNNIISQLMRYQAENSATSPISGIGGLIPMSIASDFEAGFANSATTLGTTKGTEAGNLVGASLTYGTLSTDNQGGSIKTTSIPLSYTIRNGMDPRQQLNITVPLTVVDTDGAKTVHAGAGVTYRVPLNDKWTLAPSARYSIVASKDRATAASVYSGSLTSTYVIPMSGFDLAIGNMVGYYKTGKFSAGDYSFDPGIKNTVLRNGVMLSQPISLGQKMSIEYSLVDTRYFGDKPYLDNVQEFGITLGTNKSALDARSFFRGGLTLTRAPKGTHGISANIGYWF